MEEHQSSPWNNRIFVLSDEEVRLISRYGGEIFIVELAKLLVKSWMEKYGDDAIKNVDLAKVIELATQSAANELKERIITNLAHNL